MTPRRIVLTGGPGAGKTAVLELARRSIGAHVAFVPESASILFQGGFPRESSEVSECAAQRAIVHVQTELETLFGASPGVDVMLCDRGTVDSAAYGPRRDEDIWASLGTTLAEQLARYAVVIHLEPPTRKHGYHRDAVRTESASQAAAIDARIVQAWSAHPHRYLVPSSPRFLDKVARVLEILEREIPAPPSAVTAVAS